MAEETVIGEIGVMVEAARAAKKAADKNDYKTAIQQLRVVNTQGRRLEWSGGKTGLKHLPESKEVEQIKKGISVARAAAESALSAVEHLDSLPNKEGKKPAEAAAIKEKENAYKKTAGKNITMLESTLITALGKAKAAVAVLEKADPRRSPEFLSRPEKRSSLINLLTRKGDYEHLSMDEITAIVRTINLSGADLGHTNLKGANLHLAMLQGANLSGTILVLANLKGAILKAADLSWADLRKANLDWADLTGANLAGADLREADLRGANLKGANLAGTNLMNALFLRKQQLHSAKNWEKAKGIPSSLL